MAKPSGHGSMCHSDESKQPIPRTQSPVRRLRDFADRFLPTRKVRHLLGSCAMGCGREQSKCNIGELLSVRVWLSLKRVRCGGVICLCLPVCEILGTRQWDNFQYS
ncbi:hypothetical protein BDV34DRAFT_200639 [Aspergillus parasiticus]|uniref:Uncharacterized protein n=1 Tax=Aspergillus parasiticus TaxID=5067 RepID=A0A5N6DBT4_ASPPA|nr:hypothetical protein BDV34DRAFT_200639 [Aspergillus parasiticus]